MLLVNCKPNDTVRFINDKDPEPIIIRILDSRVLGIDAPQNVKIEHVKAEKAVASEKS